MVSFEKSCVCALILFFFIYFVWNFTGHGKDENPVVDDETTMKRLMKLKDDLSDDLSDDLDEVLMRRTLINLTEYLIDEEIRQKPMKTFCSIRSESCSGIMRNQ